MKPTPVLRFSVVIWFIALLIGTVGSPGALVFAPPEAQGINDGNAVLAPFENTGRFQQVYGAEIFNDFNSAEAVAIGAICFRIDSDLGHGGFNAVLPSFQLNLSTTIRSVDGLSSLFADNVGIDDVAVLGPSSISLSGAPGGFDICFDFRDHPFLYNPREGNLLVDFRILRGFGNIGPPQGVAILDAFNNMGDPVSSVYGSTFFAEPPTSGDVTSLGLATRFSFQAVPEPSTVALLIAGLGIVALRWNRQRTRERRSGVPR